MKTILFLLVLFMNSSFAQDKTRYIFKSWCSGLKDNEVYSHIKEAADFVDIDPLHLAIGMSGEGFSQKHDTPMSCRKWPKLNQDKTMVLSTCDDNNKLVESIIQSNSDWIENKKTGKWGETDPDYDNYAIVEATYYGNGFNDDGTDTFCLEQARLKKENLFPIEFKVDDQKNVSKYESLEDAPEVVCDDTGRTNEAATMRFRKSTMSAPYSERLMVKSSETNGDEGQAYYKNGEVQTYVNAAMWKDAENKFDKAFKEVLVDYPALKNKVFSKYEKVFWSKVFYNGGQGTQAGAWFMLKKYAKQGFLKDDKYLKTRPTNTYKQLYINGRRDVDSYRYAEKIDCPGTWPKSTKPARTKKSNFKIDSDDLNETAPSQTGKNK